MSNTLEEITYPYLAGLSLALTLPSSWSESKQRVLEETNKEICQAIINSIELCPNQFCDKGKVIMETESAVIDCLVCSGRGFKVKDNNHDCKMG